jgi:hypothetical protein
VSTPPATAAVRAIQAEALSDVEAPVVLDLVPGVEIRILPIRQWRLSAIQHINTGEYLEWAKKVCASTEDYETFVDCDPTLAELEDFSRRLGEATEVGNSKPSSTSRTRSRRTRKS